MDGEQGLRYAWSRHTSTDFDRGARQQRVLLSLRQQADPQTLIPKLLELVAALKTAVRTDIPVDQLDELLGPLPGRHGQHPLVRLRAAALLPGHVPGRPRVRRAPQHLPDQAGREERLLGRPARRGPPPDACRRGCAPMGPQRRLGDRPGRAARGLSRVSRSRGVGATRPAGGRAVEDGRHRVHRRWKSKIPATIAYLEQLFDVKVTAKADPAILVDVVVTIGRNTPEPSLRRRPDGCPPRPDPRDEELRRPCLLDRCEPVVVGRQSPTNGVEVPIAHEPGDRPDLA